MSDRDRTQADAEPSCALYHAIPVAADARVRLEIVRRGLKPHVDFRNVNEPEHRDGLRSLGGSRTPALWDGARLHEGESAVLAVLDVIVPPQRR